MRHRGPDHSEHWRDEEIWLGHNRLAILDLTANGNQPMHRNRLSIVFNGEIYNHLKLRDRYLKDSDFRSSSDTETILALYEKFGVNSFNHLEGMFTLALYDRSEEKLLLVRDSLGIKPVYYFENGKTIAFASEIKSLLSLSSKWMADSGVLETYLTYENYLSGKSLFSGIRTVQPGEVISVDLRLRTTSSTYISRSQSVQELVVESDIIQLGMSVIEKSVTDHLLSDVAVGVFMSGGIDSSLVATLASRHSSSLLAFTGYFEDPDGYYDERPYTRLVAKKANIDLREVQITAQNFTQDFDKIIWHLDQPRMGMGSFSQFVVAREAAKERKVMLSGHGGDELFAGYPMIKSIWYRNRGLFKTVAALTRGRLNQREAMLIAYNEWMRKKRGVSGLAPEIFSDRHPERDGFESPSLDPLSDLFDYYKRTYLVGLLEVEDKVSMAHSLESRIPLWTDAVIDYASKIPMALKMKNGCLKYILKAIASHYLPKEILGAPKRGFPTPLRNWFRNELSEFCKERLLTANAFLDHLVPLDEREKLIRSHRNPSVFVVDERRAHKIFMLLSLESWTRQFKIQGVR
jgi:asparagine synthase (glutamine-hydrolysing)